MLKNNKGLCIAHGFLGAFWILFSVFALQELLRDPGKYWLGFIYFPALIYFHVNAFLNVGSGSIKGRTASRIAGWLNVYSVIGWILLYASYYRYKTTEQEPLKPIYKI